MEKNSCSANSREDSEDDLRLLLECLQFQKHCVSSQCQALTTLATMCSNSSSVRDRFRSTGGMNYVLELLYATSSFEIQQAALYTLGCAAEMNVINQVKLCEVKLFTFLADILKPPSNPHIKDPSSSPTTPALIATMAYLAGCLMCSNSQGQNLARERRVLHKLIGQFKSHLPPPLSVKESQQGGHYSLEVWTSVCSALCSATNNPQNEVNQSLCSQLFPAALSVLNHTSLKVDALRPAVTLIASCVSNNVSTQNRLRLVGGIQTLVTTLKKFTHPTLGQQDMVAIRGFPVEFSVHIVRTLSAAMLGHADNTQLVSTLDVIPLLLHLLQQCKRSDDTAAEDNATLNIIMCLGMLTEDRPSAQQQLVSNGGVQLLLSAMAESDDGELNKAITFVLQLCLQQPEREHNLSDEIARVEGLLTQAVAAPVEHMNAPQHNKSNTSSPSPTSSVALRRQTLKILDSQKLPVMDRVSTWLASNEECEPEQNAEKEIDMLDKLQQCMEVDAVPPPANIEKVELLQSSTDKKGNAYHSSQKKSELQPVKKSAESTPRECPTERNDTAKQHDFAKVKSSEQPVADTRKKDQSSKSASDATGKGQVYNDNSCRENLEAELARERARRIKLEKELEQNKKQESKGGATGVGNNENKLRHANHTVSVTQTSKQQPQSDAGKQQTKGSSSDESNKEFLPPTKMASTPLTKQTNIRYAASANMHQSQRLKEMVLNKHQSKTPGPGHSLSKHVLAMKSKHSAHEGVRESEKTKGESVKDKVPQSERPSAIKEHSASKNMYPVRNDADSCYNQPHLRRGHSTSNIAETSQNQLSSSLQQNQASTVLPQPLVVRHFSKTSASEHQLTCGHQCLGCKPRLRCPLITSRNFIALLKTDHFTCPYHKRLVQRLVVSHSNEREHSISFATTHHATDGPGYSARLGDECTDLHQRWEGVKSAHDNATGGNRMPSGTHDFYCVQVGGEDQDLHFDDDDVHNKASTDQSDNTPTTSISSPDTSIVNASSEVEHSHEQDPDWSPSLDGSTGSSCIVVSVTNGETNNHGRTAGVEKVVIKTENASTVASSDEDSVTNSKEGVCTSIVTKQYNGTHTTAAIKRLVLPVSKKSTDSQFTRDDHQTIASQSKTVYQLTAQPLKSKSQKHQARGKLQSLPQRNALKNVTNQQISVFDYETPQKTPNKYDQAKPKQQLRTPTDKKPQFKGRVPWSKKEEENLLSGVNKMGRKWRHILDAYTFHPCRTPVHLKDKYRNIMGRY